MCVVRLLGGGDIVFKVCDRMLPSLESLGKQLRDLRKSLAGSSQTYGDAAHL
jgi:hypothetical protein